MTYLLIALVILTMVALLAAPTLGLLLLLSTAGLLAYEFTAARYIILAIVAMNVLIVLVLLSAVLHSLIKKRISERSKASEASDRREHVSAIAHTLPPEPVVAACCRIKERRRMIVLVLAALVGASAGLVILLAQGVPVAVAIGAMPIAGSTASLLTSILLYQIRSRSDDLGTDY